MLEILTSSLYETNIINKNISTAFLCISYELQAICRTNKTQIKVVENAELVHSFDKKQTFDEMQQHVPSCSVRRCSSILSPTRRWFYQWKWQCSKSWSHSQNSLCSQISNRRGCAWRMLDGGCLLWFTTVYYYVNGKTRRVHSRDVFYWAWITRTWRDAWTIYVTHVLDTRSIRARMQSRRRCILLSLGKYWISRGRNVLLQGNSWRLRFGGLSLRFWQKNKLVRYAHSCVF